MQNLSNDDRGAVVGFVVLLCKGLLDDPQWNWDIENCDWKNYQSGSTDPTVLCTTMAVFVNTLKLNENGTVANYNDASFSAFQYFRSLIDPSFPRGSIEPQIQLAEMVEPDWSEC